MELEECLKARRDTRHFLPDPVPQQVLNKALAAAHMAPSVGLSEPWRFVSVESTENRAFVKKLFNEARQKAQKQVADEQDEARSALHQSLKLEAILDAPVGLAVFCELPSENYTIGVIGTPQTLMWSVACAIQNLWLSLTDQGYGAGWVSILDFEQLKKELDVPEAWLPLGYLCIGKPATDYDKKPMLQNQGWKQRTPEPIVLKR